MFIASIASWVRTLTVASLAVVNNSAAGAGGGMYLEDSAGYQVLIVYAYIIFYNIIYIYYIYNIYNIYIYIYILYI